MNGCINKHEVRHKQFTSHSKPGEKNQRSGRVNHPYLSVCVQSACVYVHMRSMCRTAHDHVEFICLYSGCKSTWGVKLCMRTIPLSHLIIVMSHGELSRVCQTPPLVFPSPTGQTMLVCSIQRRSAAHFNPLVTHEIASDEAEQLNNAQLSQKET